MIQQCYEDIQKATKSISLLMNRAGGVDNPTRNNVFLAPKSGQLLFYYIRVTPANIGLENHTGFSLVTTLQQNGLLTRESRVLMEFCTFKPLVNILGFVAFC